jgi:hypothetical protein
LLISPSGKAHFPGCPHKGGDPDYSPRSPEDPLRLGLNASLRGDAVGDRAVIAGDGGRSVVDLVD